MGKNREFVTVARGITKSILPDLERPDAEEILMVGRPLGPHLASQIRLWVPLEYVGEALSFILLQNDGLSVLIHALTTEEMKDHSDRAIWMGKPLDLKLDALSEEVDLPFEFPELGLGYNADPDSPYYPANWKK